MKKFLSIIILSFLIIGIACTGTNTEKEQEQEKKRALTFDGLVSWRAAEPSKEEKIYGQCLTIFYLIE